MKKRSSISMLFLTMMLSCATANPITAAASNNQQSDATLDQQEADVNGDGQTDLVILTGEKENPQDLWNSRLHIVVKDGKTGKSTELKADGNQDLSGYDPGLFLGDFTGDQAAEIMVSADTGGSGGVVNHVIVDWKSGQRIIFGEKQNAGMQIEGFFRDGFTAQLTSQAIGKSFAIHVKEQMKDYIGQLFDQQGKYTGPVEEQAQILSDPFGLLTPIDVDGDGVFELEGTQNVWGPAHVNGLTDVTSVWAYKQGSWIPVRAHYTVEMPLIEQTNGK
ncbi:hypothetical protein [Brevibacillus fulvus]|uniref:VCBS repeat-containing protein n=1 Tax=Brevibacillus fulvus TaxID=1125967 RepID=A0A938XZP8_9BACL|nr:hypothetical protein [Brevibacillus fulvus]MBM7590645.1 hypothetical protein [Brevibacillus fulvus]